jgi:hypothetical protein
VAAPAAATAVVRAAALVALQPEEALAAAVLVAPVPAIPAMEEPARRAPTVGWRQAQLVRSCRPIRLGGPALR